MNGPKGGSGGPVKHMTDGAKGKPMHPGKNKKGNGPGGLRYGAFAGYKGVARKKALRFVNADIRRLRRDTRNDVRQERRQYQRERGDIKHVYRATGQQLKDLRANSATTYANTVNGAQAAQAALQQTLQNQQGAIQGSANSELARLGLGGTDATAQMGADAQNALNVSQQNSQDNLANLGMAAANSQSLSNLMLGMNKGEKQHQLGQARNLRDENISQLRDALHEAKAGRGDSVRALLDQMAQFGWSQHMQQAQLQLQRQAQKKNQYYSGGGSYSSGGYSSQNYQPNYGYGYSSPGGMSGGSSGSSANRAKSQLYGDLLDLNP